MHTVWNLTLLVIKLNNRVRPRRSWVIVGLMLSFVFGVTYWTQVLYTCTYISIQYSHVHTIYRYTIHMYMYSHLCPPLGLGVQSGPIHWWGAERLPSSHVLLTVCLRIQMDQ